MDESNFVCTIIDKQWFLGTNSSVNKFNAISDKEKLTSTLVIPRTIDGHEIDAIGQFAFFKLYILEEIIILCQPKIIHRFAFSHLCNLYISLPQSLITLETNAITAVNSTLIEEDTENYSLTSNGVLTIVFPPHSKIKYIARRSMTRKKVIELYYWGKHSPIYLGEDEDPFYTKMNVSVIIHAPYISSFCGFNTIHIYTCKFQNKSIKFMIIILLNSLL